LGLLVLIVNFFLFAQFDVIEALEGLILFYCVSELCFIFCDYSSLALDWLVNARAFLAIGCILFLSHDIIYSLV